MQWFATNFPMILTILLVVSEAAAAICQLVFPNNQGVSGVIAAIIKILQGLGAKDPVQPSK